MKSSMSLEQSQLANSATSVADWVAMSTHTALHGNAEGAIWSPHERGRILHLCVLIWELESVFGGSTPF